MEPSITSADSPSIVQPVLQWGHSEAGGGAYWSVFSTYVKGSPVDLQFVASTRPVQVKPGDIVTSAITLLKVPEKDDLHVFTYSSEFENIDGTRLLLQFPSELVRIGLALEGYGLTSCDALPGKASFFGIHVEEDNGSVAVPQWTFAKMATCSLDIANVISNDNQDQIDITYADKPFQPLSERLRNMDTPNNPQHPHEHHHHAASRSVPSSVQVGAGPRIPGQGIQYFSLGTHGPLPRPTASHSPRSQT